MARQIGRLTALAVSRAKAAGMYSDGGGLYLQVTAAGARTWIYRSPRSARAGAGSTIRPRLTPVVNRPGLTPVVKFQTAATISQAS